MEDLDKNIIYVAVQFTFNKNIREVAAAILNVDLRKIQLCEFQDNEYLSNFESFMLQIYPQNQQTIFRLLVLYPELLSEKEKIKKILEQLNIEPDVK